MPLFGRIVVIKRNGTDGTHFPLTANSCLFGRICLVKSDKIMVRHTHKFNCPTYPRFTEKSMIFGSKSAFKSVRSTYRKKECDIRIQLPHVSKEHCKIEVNENKEATLINLSAVNPTKLNGSSFQQPTCLKNNDVLTIIDRSFRFEYPPVLVHRKRHSTSQEKETLQVLHIQQVDQDKLLHPQHSECKSLQTPDKKLEWEDKNINESDKQKTEERTTRQYGTPESIHKTRESTRKNEVSPFTQLYYLMKNEGERQTSKEDLSSEIPAQQKEYPLRKAVSDCLAGITAQTPRRSSAYKKIETIIQEEVEESREIENQEPTSVCSLGSVDGNNSRKSSVCLQAYAAEKLGSEETIDQVQFQDIKENEVEKSEVLKSDASLTANKQSAKDIAKSCCIVSLEYSDGAKSIERPTEAKMKFSLTNTFESDENSLSTSKSKGKNIQVYSSPNSRESGRKSSSKSRMLSAEVNSLLDIFSPTESSVETEGSSMYFNREEYASNIFNPNMHFEIKENNVSITERPSDSEILKGTNYNCSSDTYKDGTSGITACSPCLRRSPRRSMKQNKDFASGTCFKEILTEKVSLETHTNVSPGSDRMNTCNQLPEQTVGVKKLPQKRKARESDLLNQPSGKRKRVSFGGHLSPELFDKRLPPNSPLKRGAIPARLSLPFGNSPRAVLKKTSELGQSVSKDFSDTKKFENVLPKKAASPPACRSPTALSLATSPTSGFSSNFPQRRGRFSVSLTTSLSSSEEQGATTRDKHVPEDFTKAKTSDHEFKTPPSRRSKKIALKRNSLPCRIGTMDAIHSKRRHGASGANLIVSKSWTEILKQGAPKSPLKITTKCGLKRPAEKIPSKQLKDCSDNHETQHENILPKKASTARRSPAASPSFSSDLPQRRACSFVSLTTSSSSPEEQGATTGEKYEPKDFTKAKSREPSDHEFKTSPSRRRSKKMALKRSSLPRRSGAMDAIHSKRRSSASAANLIVAKSWAEVVKRGAPKSQPRITTKCGLKRPAKKMTSKQPKGDVAKTPARNVKGYFTTGHANSPAPIVIGKAHASMVKIVAQAPKVILNCPVKEHWNSNESFTGWNYTVYDSSSGMADMFNTPLNWKEKNSVSSVEKTNTSTPEISALHTSENSGEVTVTSFTISSQQRCNQDSFQLPQMTSLMEDRLLVPPIEENTKEDIKEIVKGSSSLGTAVNENLVGVHDTRKRRKHKSESEMFLGVKRLMRTPRQKPEPVEALSGVKRLMRTPRQKPEPVEALSGVKRLMRTPRQKPEPVEALSGVKRLMRTPRQKPEPVEALSGVKRLMRTPKEKHEPVEAISGAMREKLEVELFEDEPTCSIVVETPEVLEELQGSVIKSIPKQSVQPVVNTGISYIIEAPKEKIQPVENTEGIASLPSTPSQRFEAVEEVGLTRLPETPRQMIKPVDDYLGLQKLMAEPKQSCFSTEIDFTGIKEILDIADEYKVKLQESANLMEEHESHICSTSEPEFSESVPENEEFQQEPKLNVLFEEKSLAMQKDNGRNDPEVEDSLEHLGFGAFNEFNRGADVGNIEIECVPENSQPVGRDLQNGTIIDSVKTAGQGSPEVVDPELIQPLDSMVRGGKSGESSSTEESNTKTLCTKNVSCVPPSTNSVQTNASSDQNVTELRPEESETTKRAITGKTQHSAERNMDKESDDVMQTQEPSKESSVKMQQSVERQVATEEHEQAEAGLKETEENGSLLITKTSLRSRNRKNDRNVLKSEFTQINPLDKMQCKDFEHPGMKLVGNDVFKRNTRGKKGSEIRTCTEKDKLGSLEFIAQDTHGMECSKSNQTEIKENIMRKGKGRKVHFLLEKHNTVPLEEKCMIADESVAHEKDNAVFGSSATSKKEMTLRRRKRKASLPVCASPTRKHVLTEISEQKEGINLSLEHINFMKVDSSDCSEFQSKEHPNKILENVEIPIDHSPSKQQKVIKKKPLKRGQNKQVIYHETSKECDHQAADTQDQNMVTAVIENPPKRGRRRWISPITQVSLPLKNILAKESPPSMGSFFLAQEKCSLQYIKNKENPTETQNVLMINEQALVDDSTLKRQKVTQSYPLRRGRSKHAISHETATKYNKKSTDTKGQNMVAKNAFSTIENPTEKGRKRSIALVSQSSISSLKSLLPSSTNCNSTEEDHKKGLETTEFTTANVRLSRRGRRRKIEDIPIASSVCTRKRSQLLDNDNQKKVPEDLQGMSKDKICKRGRRNLVSYESSAVSNSQLGNDCKEATPIKEKVPLENGFGKENQPKRGRRKNNFLAPQVYSSLQVSITLPSASSDKGETISEDQNMLTRNAVGEEKVTNSSERNDKPVLRSTRRCKVPEEIFQEKQNVDLEKIAVSNEKQSRRGRRKVDATEATVSLKEKCSLTVSRGTISKDQHVILENTISDSKGALRGTQQKVRKGENLQKNSDPSNITNSDQNSNLRLQAILEKGNPSKRGKQKRVNSELESSDAISDMKKTFFIEKISSKPTSGDIKNTTLQRRKKKMKESHTTVVIQPTVEMESKIRASKRTRKEIKESHTIVVIQPTVEMESKTRASRRTRK